MADYTYNYVAIYSDSDGSLLSSGPDSGTLTDGETNDTFTVPEVVNSDSAATPGSFQGTFDSGGDTFLQVNHGGGTYLYSLASDPDSVTPPATSGDIPALDTSVFTVCFAAGTVIATSVGETKVEDLKIGDLVLTADGKEVPVLWIGLQKVHKLFTPAERFVPVRVKAGALGDGLPHSDLVLTANHALVIDGIAINAGVLVNGTTITYDPIEALPDHVTYYHVETEGHEVIMANGAPAETYVDYVQRRVFSNYAEYEKLYGDERMISEMSIPRISSARLLPSAIRNRLAGHCAA